MPVLEAPEFPSFVVATTFEPAVLSALGSSIRRPMSPKQFNFIPVLGPVDVAQANIVNNQPAPTTPATAPSAGPLYSTPDILSPKPRPPPSSIEPLVVHRSQQDAQAPPDVSANAQPITMVGETESIFGSPIDVPMEVDPTAFQGPPTTVQDTSPPHPWFIPESRSGTTSIPDYTLPPGFDLTPPPSRGSRRRKTPRRMDYIGSSNQDGNGFLPLVLEADPSLHPSLPPHPPPVDPQPYIYLSPVSSDNNLLSPLSPGRSQSATTSQMGDAYEPSTDGDNLQADSNYLRQGSTNPGDPGPSSQAAKESTSRGRKRRRESDQSRDSSYGTRSKGDRDERASYIKRCVEKAFFDGEETPWNEIIK